MLYWEEVRRRRGIALFVTAMAVGALCAMLLAGSVIARFGSAPATRAAGIAMCLALPLACLAPSLAAGAQ